MSFYNPVGGLLHKTDHIIFALRGGRNTYSNFCDHQIRP